MKMCSDHWQRLRDAIDARGMSALIAESGQDAALRVERELSDGPSVDTFDPLLSATWSIYGNATSVTMQVMFLSPDGSDPCPLCFLNAENPFGHNYDVWIDRAADDALAAWKALRA